jgi:hypothetical protein
MLVMNILCSTEEKTANVANPLQPSCSPDLTAMNSWNFSGDDS